MIRLDASNENKFKLELVRKMGIKENQVTTWKSLRFCEPQKRLKIIPGALQKYFRSGNPFWTKMPGPYQPYLVIGYEAHEKLLSQLDRFKEISRWLVFFPDGSDKFPRGAVIQFSPNDLRPCASYVFPGLDIYFFPDDLHDLLFICHERFVFIGGERMHSWASEYARSNQILRENEWEAIFKSQERQ